MPALALSGAPCPHPAPDQSRHEAPQSHESILEQIIGDGILWASVPKARRTREKRLTRKHSWRGHQEYFQLKRDIVMCPDCGSWHQTTTICGNCYANVREETDAIKAEMGIDKLKYEQPRQETAVIYEGEEELKEHLQDKFLVEMKKKRPSWFNHNLLTKR